MQFIKNLFKDNSVIGLSTLRKKSNYAQVVIPTGYKKAYMTNTQNNYLLF